MVWNFGDSFDLYTNAADYFPYYWDSGNASFTVNGTGRFGGRCMGASGTGIYVVKSSNVNDAVHHLVIAYNQTTAIGGSGLGQYFILSDGATAQCTVVFRSDGAILLTSGIQTGTVLATYTGAVTATGVWNAFEFEVIINNTTGSFRVRKNGNVINDFDSGAILNTRGGTTNNYANRVTIGQGGGNGGLFDDFYWRSDAASVAWIGDMRCYVRMPQTDVSTQFTRTPTSFVAQSVAGGANISSATAGIIRSFSVVATTSGTLANLFLTLSAGATGHAKMALYDATGTGLGPGTLICQSTEITNPVTGVNTFTVPAGIVLQRGVTYWISLWSDVVLSTTGNSITVDTVTLAYTTTFPSPMPVWGATGFFISNSGLTITSFNAGVVNEPQQDALASYVVDSIVGHADFYALGALALAAVAVVAVTTRAYMTKSDAGTRIGALQVRSGATTVATPSAIPIPTLWQWTWRVDVTDPNTGGAWTTAAVDSLQLGPYVVA